PARAFRPRIRSDDVLGTARPHMPRVAGSGVAVHSRGTQGRRKRSAHLRGRLDARCAPPRSGLINLGMADSSTMSISSILGPDGVVAQRLTNYESRSQQLDMADAVAEALAEKHHLMVEAGTGVGKSFAYLVPAVQFALQAKENRVVI